MAPEPQGSCFLQVKTLGEKKSPSLQSFALRDLPQGFSLSSFKNLRKMDDRLMFHINSCNENDLKPPEPRWLWGQECCTESCCSITFLGHRTEPLCSVPAAFPKGLGGEMQQFMCWEGKNGKCWGWFVLVPLWEFISTGKALAWFPPWVMLHSAFRNFIYTCCTQILKPELWNTKV